MHLLDSSLILSPSDLTGFLDCDHLTQLDLRSARGELTKPAVEDPELDVVRRRGAEHEAQVLDRYLAGGKTVSKISCDAATLVAYQKAQNETLAAMRAGTDVIYQGVLFNGRWLGYVDFLERVQGASTLGEHSYEVVDTKLARHTKTAAIVQTALYSWLLGPLQGVVPETMHLVLGDGARHTFRVADYADYVGLARRRLEDAVPTHRATYPEPVERCGTCRWRDQCRSRWLMDDHLSLVAGMRRDQATKLRSSGISTVAQLAAAPADLNIEHMADGSFQRLALQAHLQVQGRERNELLYRLLPAAEPGPALADLPEPVIGDLFLDLEGDPYVDGGLEYLFGITELTIEGPRYQPFWAHSRSEEKATFEAVIDFITQRLERTPSIHVYHYASYEESALKRLMGLHATREPEVDRLLRGGVLIDLYQVVRRALRISQDSYGLKAVERFYMPERQGKLHDAGSSIVAYELWLERHEQTLLDEIQSYNEEDCTSTLKLRDWLESLRAEFELQFKVLLARPTTLEGRPDEQQDERERDTSQLCNALTSTVPDSTDDRTAEEQARWLLGQSLWFHRREQKPQWWAHFQRLRMTTSELVEDSDALGDMSYFGEERRVKRSIVHRYGYPQQEHKILPGSTPLDPRTEKPAGTVEEVDPVQRLILLRRGIDSDTPHPLALIPGNPPNDMPLRIAIRRVADWVLANGMDAPGPYRAIRDLLLRVPRLPETAASPANQAAVAMVTNLEDTCLGIQGPPGSGKTTTGAEMVIRLVRAGKHVGLTALSHKVIGHFLEAVYEEARKQGLFVRMVQKAEPEEFCDLPGVKRCGANSEVVTALNTGEMDVVAGTAWLFADTKMENLLDTLFVDEAGQVPLANVIAVGGAARNVILLGDPNQLAQPIQGLHPEGAAVSSLQHLLGTDLTMPENRGLFLDLSWRMQPELCRFISEIAYEGRLLPAPGCELQVAAGQAGIRFVPMEHSGNRTSSIEEAGAVADLVQSLVGQDWTNRAGHTARIRLDDILIVAPYNSQVGLLGRVVPGARVGTVDKFQGQQGAVAVYSMATSSPDDAPRGVDFLYSLNRLNVAVSRAHALAVVVCSPTLLLLRPRSPEQMRLANALCRLSLVG